MENFPLDMVRAFFRSVTVEGATPPYNTIHLKVYYPARRSGSEQENNLGIIPPNREKAPFPVIIWFNGFNCSPDTYQWLALDLVQRGFVFVTFAWVAENLPGVIALTPGVDVKMWSPDHYGTGVTASALPALLEELETLQSEGMLAGYLDLQRVILGGHSAGGRVAIESASQAYFPQLAGAFSYAAHTAVGTNLGYEAGTILPLPDSLPVMLLGGTCDGVIANSSHRYDTVWEDATTPIRRTFTEGLTGGRGDSYLMIIEGANHFSVTYPHDSTTARAFLDFPATRSETEIRSLMVTLIGSFLEGHILQNQDALTTIKTNLKSSSSLLSCGEFK